MSDQAQKYYQELKKRGLSAEQEGKIRRELEGRWGESGSSPAHGRLPHPSGDIYGSDDNVVLQGLGNPMVPYTTALKSIDDLLDRDKRREEDGFPRKIRVGRLIKPGKGDKDKVVVVPTTVEEKFIHDAVQVPSEEQAPSGGSGEGEEGDVIGEQPVQSQEGAGSGPGSGESGPHELESSAYDLGRILTEQFQLPNLKEKGKKRSLTRFTYEMTDRHRGFGQLLDKKATLRQIVETNLHLGRIPDYGAIEPADFLISPEDRVYRILSKEKTYESQAMVFFLRDYSGSMTGKPTELVVSQHVLIYSWLLYQYAKQVESRFVLHDTEAKEVPDFYTYYNYKVAGGTKVASAYRLVNEIVAQENLAQDYNIYVFHGTDGDDWDSEGKETLPEIEQMLNYASRLGITIAQRGSSKDGTEVERYLKGSGLLESKSHLIRLNILQEDADEAALISGIKLLISEDAAVAA